MLTLWQDLTDIPDYCIYDDVTGLILAGGRALRMNGIDKALVPFQGRPLIDHVIHRLSPQVSTIFISSNRDAKSYAGWQYPVYADVMPGYLGPLAGMLTGLYHCQTQYMVCVPCDAPFLDRFLVKDLFHTLDETHSDIAVACTGEDKTRMLQSVFCLMKTTVRDSLEKFIQDGGRKIDHWFQTQKTCYTQFSDIRSFANMNTLSDLTQNV